MADTESTRDDEAIPGDELFITPGEPVLETAEQRQTREEKKRERGTMLDSMRTLESENQSLKREFSEVKGLLTGLSARLGQGAPSAAPQVSDQYEARLQELDSQRNAELRAFSAKPAKPGTPEFDASEKKINDLDREIRRTEIAQSLAFAQAATPRQQPAVAPEAAQLAREFQELTSFRDSVTGENTALQWAEAQLRADRAEGKPVNVESVRARLTQASAKWRLRSGGSSVSASEQAPYRGTTAGPTSFEPPAGSVRTDESHRRMARTLYGDKTGPDGKPLTEQQQIQAYVNHYLTKPEKK